MFTVTALPAPSQKGTQPHPQSLRGWVIAIAVTQVVIATIILILGISIAVATTRIANSTAVQQGVSDVLFTLSAVRNVSGVVEIGVVSAAHSMGLGPVSPTTTAHRRLLQMDNLLNSTDLQLALTALANAATDKLQQLDATAPGALIQWIISTNWRDELGPYVHDMLSLVRYGEATAGTFLKAMGSPVNASIVGRMKSV